VGLLAIETCARLSPPMSSAGGGLFISNQLRQRGTSVSSAGWTTLTRGGRQQ
jgi:hypothetical protein